MVAEAAITGLAVAEYARTSPAREQLEALAQALERLP
jgi:hypothetical protein